MTLKRFVLYGAATLTALTLASCGGGDGAGAPETTSTSVPATTLDGAAPSATALINRSNPGEVTSFSAMIGVLDRVGISHSADNDTTDDPYMSDPSSGSTEVEGLGTAWYFNTKGDASGVMQRRLDTADPGDRLYVVVGKNFGIDIYNADNDDAASELANAFGASLYVIR
ncbi:hypothetical protein [Corynebacterium neomassiliense]|uniref:hypothetical protein n=1 Tax=Corynebacterium neomassiliense TaxID=2079482 RepID=UPI0010317D16|nr:hypothetical protein [Corynebacterium neomassiliense]